MPRDDDDRRGVAAWLRRWWRALVAELVATALLVGLGVASMVPGNVTGDVPLAHPAMAFGFVVTGLAVAAGPASGAHMNPAVTLAAVIAGRLPWAPAVGYALAQMVGAVLGFGALVGIVPQWAGGCTDPAPAIGAPAAAAIEAAITGLLALVCCALWAAHDPARPDPAAPIKVGLVVAGLVYAGGAATGASLNPARSFAPALLRGHWTAHWVYWVGPLGGAALAALLHRFVLTPPARAPRTAPEQLPLADKP